MLKRIVTTARPLTHYSSPPKHFRTMASATKVQLSTDVGDWPEYYRPGISEEQTKAASEILQENHDNHHIFFHSDGLHNHIAHHQLAIWALNASSEVIQRAYEKKKGSQRPQPPVNQDILKELESPSTFMKHLGPRDNYHTFLEFFKNEIESQGWQDVLQKYMFAGDERANDMLVRMYAGFLVRSKFLDALNDAAAIFLTRTLTIVPLSLASNHSSWIRRRVPSTSHNGRSSCSSCLS